MRWPQCQALIIADFLYHSDPPAPANQYAKTFILTAPSNRAQTRDRSQFWLTLILSAPRLSSRQNLGEAISHELGYEGQQGTTRRKIPMKRYLFMEISSLLVPCCPSSPRSWEMASPRFRRELNRGAERMGSQPELRTVASLRPVRERCQDEGFCILVSWARRVQSCTNSPQ